MNILEVQDLCKTYGKGEAAVQAFGQSQNIQQLVDKPLVWPLVVKQQRKSDVLFYIQFRDQIK